MIGSVILHDKLKYWTSGDKSIHYHQGKNYNPITQKIRLIILHMHKYHLGSCSLLKHCIVSNYSVSGQQSPDQTTCMQRLTWAFAVHICPKTCFAWCGPCNKRVNGWPGWLSWMCLQLVIILLLPLISQLRTIFTNINTITL